MTERVKLALKKTAASVAKTTEAVAEFGKATRKAAKATQKLSSKAQAAVSPDKGLKPVEPKKPRSKRVPLQAIVQTAVANFDDGSPHDFMPEYGGGGKFTARSQRTRKMSKADKCFWAMHEVHKYNREAARLRAA